MPGVEDNAIIEYVYSEKYESIMVPPWEFQEDDPVVFSGYFLDIPRSITYKFLKKEPSGVTIEMAVNVEQGEDIFDTRTKAEYKCSHLPGISQEPNMPPKLNLTAKLLFAPVLVSFLGLEVPLDQSSWSSVSKSYYEMTKSQINSTSKEMENALLSLAPDKSTDYDKIKAVYEYLRKGMRYVAVEIGAENVIPHSADEIFKNKYGDCKDMSTLFVAMLKKCRIEAYLGLVSSVPHGELSREFPSFDQIDHVVVCVPARYFTGHKELDLVLARGEMEFLLDDDYLILDLTCKTCGFGDLPWYIQNTSILVVKEENGGLVKTPHVPAAGNSTRSFYTLSIDSVGTVNGEVKTLAEGEDAIWLRDFLIHTSPDQQKEWLLKGINQDFTGAELLNYNFQNLEECDSALVLEFSFRTKDLLNMQAEISTFPAGKLNLAEENKFSKPERKYPIFFRYKRKISSYYRIILPNQLKAKELPQNVSKTLDWGTFVASYMISGKEVSCIKEFLIENCLIPAEEYQEVKEFYDVLSKCDNDNIILCKTKE